MIVDHAAELKYSEMIGSKKEGTRIEAVSIHKKKNMLVFSE